MRKVAAKGGVFSPFQSVNILYQTPRIKGTAGQVVRKMMRWITLFAFCLIHTHGVWTKPKGVKFNVTTAGIRMYSKGTHFNSKIFCHVAGHLKLKRTATGGNPTKYQFYLDGQIIKMYQTSGEHTINFAPALAGTYRCQAKDAQGNESDMSPPYTLVICGTYHIKFMNLKTTPFGVIYGNDAEMKCELGQPPYPPATKYQIIRNTDPVTIVREFTSSPKFTVKAVKIADEGLNYMCGAINEEGGIGYDPRGRKLILSKTFFSF